jgi:hypothetical protein
MTGTKSRNLKPTKAPIICGTAATTVRQTPWERFGAFAITAANTLSKLVTARHSICAFGVIGAITIALETKGLVPFTNGLIVAPWSALAITWFISTIVLMRTNHGFGVTTKCDLSASRHGRLITHRLKGKEASNNTRLVDAIILGTKRQHLEVALTHVVCTAILHIAVDLDPISRDAGVIGATSARKPNFGQFTDIIDACS